MLALAKEERTKRLQIMVDKIVPSDAARVELKARVAEICGLFGAEPSSVGRAEFLAAFEGTIGSGAASAGYTQTIQGLPAAVTAAGVAWLQSVVDDLCRRVEALVREMDLFED